MRTLLRGGAVVSGSGTQKLDILVENETIYQVGQALPAGGAEVVDCAGRLLFPGFIDGHTHIDLSHIHI